MVNTTIKRRAHTDYVNHMIRFYFSSPDSLQVAGHTAADVKNWLSVQAVMASLDDQTRELIRELYTSGKSFEDTVREYAGTHGVSVGTVWGTYVRVTTSIARERGLI